MAVKPKIVSGVIFCSGIIDVMAIVVWVVDSRKNSQKVKILGYNEAT